MSGGGGGLETKRKWGEEGRLKRLGHRVCCSGGARRGVASGLDERGRRRRRQNCNKLFFGRNREKGGWKRRGEVCVCVCVCVGKGLCVLFPA